MSDIPIGSPPVPPGRHAAPSGWYPDPVDQSQERYWDGWQWSRNTRESEHPQPPTPHQPWQQGAQPQGYGWQPGGQQPPYQPSPNQHPPYQPSPNQQPPYQQPTGQYQQQPAHPGGAQPAVLTADGVPVAGWWWRVLAVVVDSIIVSIIAAIPSVPIYIKVFGAISAMFNEMYDAARAGQPPPPVPATTDLISTSDQFILSAITVAVGFIYAALFWRLKGATPGKMICGLRVVPVDQGQHRTQLPWSIVVPRALVWVIPGASGLLVIFQLLDVLFPLWQPKRQAIHDLVAKTQVVKIK